MARIYGWAVRGRSDEVEHTYVTCDNGSKWECFGQARGGMLICEGTVSQGVVECIASQDSSTGIEYCVTGISHQAANRLLWGSKGLVCDARGFWACAMLFGVYGSDVLDWLKDVSASLPQSAQQDKDTPSVRRISPELRELVAAIQDRYMKAMRSSGRESAESLLKDEFVLMIESKLGRSYSRYKSAQLMKRHAELMEARRELESRRASGKLGEAEYVRQLDAALNSTLLDMACDIGIRDFIALFEIDPSRPLRLKTPRAARKQAPRPRYNKPNGAKAAARKR